MNGPIDTLNFMLMGFAVIFGALILHLWSLRVRRRNLEKDLEMLDEINKRD